MMLSHVEIIDELLKAYEKDRIQIREE